MKAIRKFLPLFLVGGLMNLALAPFYFFPILFLSFPVFYTWLKKAPTAKQAFWCGWWFGFGYFVFGLYWISNSLLVDLRFAWLIPFAVSLIPAAAGLFTGAVGYLYKRIGKQSPSLLALLWILAEFVKGYFPFGGFPWNNIGYASLFSTYFAQVASIGGVYLAGLIILYVSLLPVYYKNKYRLAFSVLLVASIFSYGISYVTITPQENSGKTVTIIQPNIAQTLKWDPDMMRVNFFDTLGLALQSEADITIWPESSVPYQIEREPAVRRKIAEATPNGKITVASSTRVQGNYEKIWNSLYVIGSRAEVLAHYDKHHLVPFGEYVPFRSILPIDKITPGMTDFSAGEKGKVLDVNNMKFLPLICYEIIFPQYAEGDYDFIVNITNDAWFGNSTGPQQHLGMAQMRAIEQGRPVLRAANTGVSAVIDAYGQIRQRLGYGKQGVITAEIPHKVKTLYSLYGNLIFLLSSIFIIVGNIVLVRIKISESFKTLAVTVNLV